MSKLTKKDLWKFSLRYMLCSQGCFNYETMQSPGAVYAIGPAIEKIYDHDEEIIKEKLKQHLQFFNTQTTFGSLFWRQLWQLKKQKQRIAQRWQSQFVHP